MKRRQALLLWSLLPGSALAQTQRKQSAPIYRCGPEGRQLSDKPCADGAPASAVRFDEPSAADRDAAQRRSREEAAQAKDLEARRERFERQPSPAPQRLSAPPVDAPPPKKAKPDKPPKAPKASKAPKPSRPSKPKKQPGDKARDKS